MWVALWIVYIVWGSTYLAIRLMVRTVPPLLGGGVRFLVAGGVMCGLIAARRGLGALRLPRPQLASTALIGALLPAWEGGRGGYDCEPLAREFGPGGEAWHATLTYSLVR